MNLILQLICSYAFILQAFVLYFKYKLFVSFSLLYSQHPPRPLLYLFSHMSLSACFDLFPPSVSSMCRNPARLLARCVNTLDCAQSLDHQISHFIEIVCTLHEVQCATMRADCNRLHIPFTFTVFHCKLGKYSAVLPARISLFPGKSIFLKVAVCYWIELAEGRHQ